MKKRAMEIALRQFSRYLQILNCLRTRTFRPSKQCRVYMSFARTATGWHCRFHADDLPKTPISRQFIFRTAEKICEAARRGEGLTTEPSRRALDEAVSLGRGGLWLHLTARQYSALVTAKRSDPQQK